LLEEMQDMTGRPATLPLLRRWLGAYLGRNPGDAAGPAVPRAAPAGQPATSPAPRSRRHHCVISGTGRAGTSFLIQLLTKLRLDTGFTQEKLGLHANARAGLETDIRKDNAPYIVKSPWLCDYIEDVLASPDIAIDHAIIPMRSISGAAQSRIEVERGSTPEPGVVPGGLWGTKREEDQERILLSKFYALLWPLVRHDVPITFLAYPRLVVDPAYLYDRLSFLVPGFSFQDFEQAWREVVRPEWVHQFARDDAPPAEPIRRQRPG
jgi:hypothetical protein